MAETGNIEALAQLVAKDIFKWFKWEQSPVNDVNWECVQDHHEKSTHPSDTVFVYINPYSGKRIYREFNL
jgi:hypothetical protein